MARIIGPKGNRKLIVEHVHRTLKAGLADGGEIGTTIDGRLRPVLARVEATEAAASAATEEAAKARAALAATDEKSKRGIRMFKDVTWNLLGRSSRNPQMQLLFPAGVEPYLSPRPEQQPMVMKVLISRVASLEVPLLPEDEKEEWLAKLERLGLAQEAAFAAYRPLEGAEMVAASEHRAAVLAALAALVAVKRDLKTLGLSERQVHEYIPDASMEARSGVRRTPRTAQRPRH